MVDEDMPIGELLRSLVAICCSSHTSREGLDKLKTISDRLSQDPRAGFLRELFASIVEETLKNQGWP